MITTALIAFREFFEAVLLVSIFLGISKKLSLKREKDILFASLAGFTFSLVLSIIVYLFADTARGILTHERAELLEAYLMIFSGCFIAYVIFSLHSVLSKNRGGKLLQAHKVLESKEFDFSLFLMIATLVGREGIEVALFTATTSLFTVFSQNVLGLILGFITAALIGSLSYVSYLKFPIHKVFKVTEYLIILVGASLVQNGVTELFEQLLHIRLGDVLPLPLGFLPDAGSFVGHFLKTFTGVDNQISLPRLAIMTVYIGTIYWLFLRKKHIQASSQV